MLVAYDARSLYGNISGIGKYTKLLLESIIRTDRKINFLLCSNREISYNGKQCIKLYSRNAITKKINSFLWFQIMLPVILKQYKVDVFHGTMFLLPILSSIPSVITIYDLVLDIYPQTMYWKNRITLKFFLKNSAKKAKKIIAISENTRRDIIKYLQVEPEKIKVIYLGVGKEFLPQKKESDKNILLKYNLLPDYILTVGTLEPRKNLTRLLDAYKMIVANEQHIPQLVIVGGQGWLSEEIKNMVILKGLSEKVVFTGYVSDSDLPALYRNAALFVYPSLYEGFGLPPLEAMSCGTPVISSNVSSIPEVVGDAGLLVDPYRSEEIAQAINVVLNDSELKDCLKKKGLDRAGLFSWDKAARETLKLYEEVVEEKKR